jgi:hypothetical protein
VIPQWVSSSRCADGYCVEVARLQEMVLIRDNKDLSVEPLEFDSQVFDAFLSDVRQGLFDRR